MSTTSSSSVQHILMFPFPSSGHIIPMLDLANQLLTMTSSSSSSVTITILVTPQNAPLLQPLLSSHPHSVYSLILSPSKHDDSTAKGLISMMLSLYALRTPIIHWFKSHPSPPTAIVSDFFLGWTNDLASELGVPRVTFSPSGAFYILLSDFLWRKLPRNTDDDDDMTVSFEDGIPNSPLLPWWQLSQIYRSYHHAAGDPDWEFLRDGMLANSVSWGIVFNTFTQLEHVYIEHVKIQAGHSRVWAVGPLLPDDASSDSRGGASSVSAHDVLAWLDQRSDRSVVYVCFGSRADLTRQQIETLATGLESSGVHFVWSLGASRMNKGAVSDGRDEILDGYEDRVADRGYLIRGWAPQVDILRHKAVGAFLTHCGWNSVLEGLTAGVVMLTWPTGADQFANAMLLVDELGVGVRVGEGTKTCPHPQMLVRILKDAIEEGKLGMLKRRGRELRDAAASGKGKGLALDDFIKKLSEENLNPVTRDQLDEQP